jgi:hypothetical protein
LTCQQFVVPKPLARAYIVAPQAKASRCTFLEMSLKIRKFTTS